MDISRLPELNKILQDVSSGKSIQVNGCVPSQMEHLLSILSKQFDFTVIVASDDQKASEILSNYIAFNREAYFYPAKDPVFFKADIQGSYLSEQRTEVIRRIYENQKCAVVTTLDAFTDTLFSVSEIEERIIRIKVGECIDVKEIAERLVELGYENELQVEGHGEFSIRGNIIDIFPYSVNAPYRIDLFGDEIESIKIFDVESQRSIESVKEFKVFPGGDKNEDSADASAGDTGFLNYFEEKNTLFVVCEPARIIKSALGMNPLAAADTTDDSDIKDDILSEDIDNYIRILNKISEKSSIFISTLGETPEQIHVAKTYNINTRNVPSYNGRFLDLVEDLKKYRKEGYSVTLVAASESRVENMIKNLADNGVSVGEIKADPANHIKASDIQVKAGSVRSGFEYPGIRVSLISEIDIFGNRRAKKKKKRYSGNPIKDFTDLNIGDYVVHEQHGVGVYEGIERIKVDGIEKDYMKIGYAKNASLYVLATQFDKIQKYGGAEGAKPKINRLGGKEWVNTKERVKAAVQDIAADLVKLYAARQQQAGYRFGPDTVWQQEFEDAFEFEETEDQKSAIEAVKEDMESSRIMDRLICGDVGFGKTEIAIRAAFKAVQEGKQVALLTPTTILSQQHYNTFCKRMENYPVIIKQLSRFAGAKEQGNTIKELTKGQVDIVIGTHRLLSKDVKFKDLGLLIVDEEQRFGVTHKEKIKQMRQNVDVLTLSATPIPRTLHMSLTGIRDMSILSEPPVDRVPIQTYVMEYSDEAVKEAISREAARGGQVYYVYNRTNNIDLVADRIQKMLPHLNVTFAHGQMASRELEKIMYEFIDGTIDVLVSTTIIETGLDISNVNTIIIHDADNFGLSQLYQLRGRVGRSNRTAYAFLMYRRDKLIKEVAEKRLKAIREFSDLGSGIKIAMRDLEIRGAGNILGAEQSGHMEAVGYELYCKMLNEAVALLKGEHVLQDFETTVDLKIDGFIPATYIVNEYEKLNMYKKISAIESIEELEDIHSELKDRFGEVPKVTENLLSVALIKSVAHLRYVIEITNAKNNAFPETNVKRGIGSVKPPAGNMVFKISMLKNAPIDTFKMLEFLRNRSDELKFSAENNPYFLYRPNKNIKTVKEIQETLIGFFDTLTEIIDENINEDKSEEA